MELNDLVYKKIVKLSEQGDELADNDCTWRRLLFK